MAELTIQLPPQRVQMDFNLRRWVELLEDKELARFEGRIETNRHGQIIMSPPLAPDHGSLQLEVGHHLRQLMPHGRTITECPISTADGVRAADVAWVSPDCMTELGNLACFPRAPEICVEVISPSNTEAEMEEKMALYFDAGAHEVWLCGEFGAMRFFGPKAARPLSASEICPRFPKQIDLA